MQVKDAATHPTINHIWLQEYILKKLTKKNSVVAGAVVIRMCNPSTWEMDTRGLL